MYIGYQHFGFWYLMEERLGFAFISLLSFKGPHIHTLKGHTVSYLGEALHFKLKSREFKSRWGYRQYSLTNYFRPSCDTGVDTASDTNECQGFSLGINYTGFVLVTN